MSHIFAVYVAFYNLGAQSTDERRGRDYLKHGGDGSIKLPSGGSLTRRRFRQLGLACGMHGGIDTIHDLVLRASAELETVGHLTRQTLSAIDGQSSFDDNLIYAFLHEPIVDLDCLPRLCNMKFHALPFQPLHSLIRHAEFEVHTAREHDLHRTRLNQLLRVASLDPGPMSSTSFIPVPFLHAAAGI